MIKSAALALGKESGVDDGLSDDEVSSADDGLSDIARGGLLEAAGGGREVEL